MNGKSRYRLQMKLQAALGRVVEVLTRFEAEDLPPNTRNVFLAAGVSDLLAALVSDLGRAPAREDFDARTVVQAAGVVERRRKETKARRRRQRGRGKAAGRPKAEQLSSDLDASYEAEVARLNQAGHHV
jgi:hypothetical protein